MSFTRFHDDPCRIKKQLQESTDPGRYILNVPGNGVTPYYINDPYIRMQKWGGNLMTNVINVESDLKGMSRTTTRDCTNYNDYKLFKTQTDKVDYPSFDLITEQSRATHPAWTARDLEQVNWYYLPLDPQENVCFPFENNLNTRILEKDNHVTKMPTMCNN